MSPSIEAVVHWWKDAQPPGNGGGAAHAPVGPAPVPWLAELDRLHLPRSLTYPSTTLGRMLDQSVERFADATAVRYNSHRWTYRQLGAQVNRMAGGLAKLGVHSGDRVLLTLPTCPEFIVSFFAIQKLGAVAINAGPLMGTDDLRHLLSLTSPRVAIGLDLQSPILRSVAGDSTLAHWVWVTLQSYQPILQRMGYRWKLWHTHWRPADKAQHISMAELLATAPSRPPSVEPDPAATALLQPTGGTTGSLKLAQISHRNLLANAMQISIWMDARPAQECILCVLPFFHVYGLGTCLIAGLFGGSRLALMTHFTTRQFIEIARQHRPTVLSLVPAMIEAVCDRLERKPEPGLLSSARLCMSGAAPLPPELARRFEKLTGTPIIEGYGLTEASPVTHANPPGHTRPGSIGLPLPDTDCRIVDESNPSLDAPTGELLINGPQVMSGYFGDLTQTQAVFHTDPHGVAWLHTGDIVRVDEAGYFYVLDRKKDMIIRSGLKVYPTRVEEVLLHHDRVADAAVVGKPDPIHTESVIAFIVIKPAGNGGGPAVAGPAEQAKLTEDLRRFCREHLSAYEVPGEFRFVPRLPRSPLGKLLRREIRANLKET